MAVRSRGSLKDAPAFQPYTAVEVFGRGEMLAPGCGH